VRDQVSQQCVTGRTATIIRIRITRKITIIRIIITITRTGIVQWYSTGLQAG
jgi:hypothetical protein